MYARMSTFQARPGQLAELATLLKGEPIKLALQQPGARGVLGLIDPVNEQAIAISLWETEQQRDATSLSSPYYQDILRQIAQVAAGTPRIENYEAELLLEIQEGAAAARQTSARIQQGQIPTLRELMRGSITKDAVQQVAIKGLLLLVDVEGRSVSAISFWEHEQALLASETSGYYQAQRDKLADIVAGTMERRLFGVEIQKLVLAHAR